MTTNNTHPDFIRTLSTKQAAWLTANGIEANEQTVWSVVSKRQARKLGLKPGYQPRPVGWGFYFEKNEHYVLPIAANANEVVIMRRDYHEDSDGERFVESFPRLRDALVWLAKNV